MLYGDGSSGNGTLFSDTFQLEALRAQLLFGVMHEESHNFELPYADGFFGLAFQKGACHPACIPPVMDSVVKQTGIQNIFTMCVSRYGGTLVLGAADRTLATQEYSYIDMVRNDMANRFVVPVMSEWKIGARSLDMPGMVGALWSTSTTNIGLPKNAFMALLDHLLKYHCNVPNLCSANSWFRPLKCSAMTAEMVGSMPNVTIPLSESESLTLTPEDYLVKYRIIGGVQHRCVAFAAMIGLEEKGAGVLLGTCVMSRYAIVFDRSKRRVGLSYANTDRCGPKSGSDVGLPAPRQGELKDDAILTADSPLAKQPVDDDDVRQRLNTAEICRAENECSACAQLQNCSFGYQTGRCVPSDEINGRFYPYCSGVTCMCIATGPSGWYVGIVLGVILGICMTLVSIMMYRKRARRLQYESVQTYEEQDLETF